MHIAYSNATDVTAGRLAEALGIPRGNRTEGLPNMTRAANRPSILICWGVKTNEDVNIPNAVTVLNHPNHIRRNRNKLEALGVLAGANGVAVAPFTPVERRERGQQATNIQAIERLGYPMIGRKKYHQGGKGFWTVLSRPMLVEASKECAYFQKYIPIQDEYRIHVYGDNVIYVARKAVQQNPVQSWVASMTDKVQGRARSENRRVQNLDYILGIIAEQVALPDMIIRSNTRGWKHSRVRLDNANRDLMTMAIRAIAALGLTFGAVDMATDTTGRHYVIEVNSAPGLEGSTLEAWATEFQRQVHVIRGNQQQQNARQTTAAATQGQGAPAGTARATLNEITENATEEEAAAIVNLLNRIR